MTTTTKNITTYSGWIAFIILLLLFQKCQPEPKIITVEIPEKKGEFIPQKPTHTDIYIKGKNTIVENPINDRLRDENDRLREDFDKANDSIKSLLFKDAIAIKSFNSKFEDKNVIIDINGIVRGEVQEITPNYTRKKQTIAMPIKQTYLRVLGGVEIANTIQFDEMKYKANIGIQNASGDVYNVGYDNNKNIYIGFSKKLFEFKR